MLFISLVFAILNNVNAGTVINDGHLCSKETNTMTCDDYYRVYTCDASTGTTGTNCKSSDNKKICVDNANGWSTNQCTRVSYGWTVKNWNCWEGHQWASDLRCSKCAKGRYRGYTGAANVAKIHNQPLFCSACPEGTYSNQEGLAVCDNCLAGKYQTSCEQGSTDGVTTNAGCRQCKTCPQGWWQNEPKASTCKQCGVGTYNDQNGRTNENADCHECQAGRAAPATGAVNCDLCTPGKITDDTAGGLNFNVKSACHDCPAGFSANGNGLSICTTCEAGKISSAGQGSCVSCDAGKAPNTDKNACENCAAGTYELNNICTPCAVGYMQDVAAQTSCKICPAGTKRASGDSAAATCPSCNNGNFQGTQGQTVCVSCTAGLFTDAVGPKASCSNCAPGRYSAAAANVCTDCEAGKASPAVAKPAGCIDCDKGSYQNSVAQTACKSCSVSPGTAGLMYQDVVGQNSCKTCNQAGEVANSALDGCDNCIAVKSAAAGISASAFVAANYATFANNGGCDWCNGCPFGQTKTSCAETSCSVCIVGQYKAFAHTSVNTDALKGVGWNTPCVACPACDPGKYRLGGNCLSGGGATTSEMTSCVNCPGNTYKIQGPLTDPISLYNDICTPCAVCDIGATRTSCGLASPGACSPWTTPTVTSVSGTGKTSGGTAGNEILDIYGKFYGHKREGTEAVDVVVKYGNTVDQSTWYTALTCNVVTADEPLASLSNDQNLGQIRCLTAPGYGTGHKLTVTIGTGSDAATAAARTSAVYDAGISYAAPIVAVYAGPGASDASTYGGQSIIVTGANFGPIGTTIDSAFYGEGLYQLAATGCVVTTAHTEMSCTTIGGAGKGLKLVVTIGGQQSTIPAINYGSPKIKSKSCGTTHGAIVSGEPQCSCANCKNLASEVPAITIGSQPCWYRTDVNNVASNPCYTADANDIELPTPVSGDFDGGTRLSTKGYQIIVLSGINFGTAGTNAQPMELEAVTYGPNTGREVVMPLVPHTATLTKSVAGCQIHKATFSIICNTKPGIAGPHKWFVTVKGQTSQEIVTTQYSPPQIHSISPTKFSTSGGTTVTIVGDEFGTSDPAASFRVVFTKGPAVSSCANAASTCHEISATKQSTLANGKERVTFTTPSGFGPEWNLRMIVTNSATGQSTIADKQTINVQTNGVTGTNELIFENAHNMAAGTAVVYTKATATNYLTSAVTGTNELVFAAPHGLADNTKIIFNNNAITGVTGTTGTNGVVVANELKFGAPHGRAVKEAIVYECSTLGAPVCPDTPIVGLNYGQTYYVLAGSDSSSIKLSLTKSSADTTAMTISGGAAGNIFNYYKTISELTEGTVYYSLGGTSASKLKLQATSGGGAVTFASGLGGANQLISTVVNIPELNDGQTYYVLTGTTSAKMKLELAVGSGAITIAAGGGGANNVISNEGLGYLNPHIDGVTIVLTDSLYTITILGANFCDHNTENCGQLWLCGGGDNIAYCDASTSPDSTTLNQVASNLITSWSHNKIEAKVGVGTDFVYVTVGQGVGLATAKSNYNLFSTNAYNIEAGGSFSVNSAGTDIEYPIDTRVPTIGQATPKLIIYVINLEAPDGVKVIVGGNQVPAGSNNFIDVNDVTLLSDASAASKRYSIAFSAPAGSGSKQTVRVSRFGKETTNSAYLYYEKPSITQIVLPKAIDTVCTAVSADCPSVDVTPGIIPTEGGKVIIIGNNLGVHTDLNYFVFRWQSEDANFVDNLHYRDNTGYHEGNCAVHTHNSVECTLPPSQGTGYTMFVEIAGQTPTVLFPGNGKSIAYAPPSINSATATPAGLVPATGNTINPGSITVNGKNMGLLQPTMKIDGKTCIVDAKANNAGYHTAFTCTVQDGEGANLAAVVTSGDQSSTTGATFSYNAPVITDFNPKTVSTSGKDANGDPVEMTITGSNFGTNANEEIKVIFKTLTESPNLEFIVQANQMVTAGPNDANGAATTITGRSHTQLKFPIPEGYGSSVDILVVVRGQTSAVVTEKFAYIAPTVTSIAPKCGAHNCYGFRNPGYKFIHEYPKITSITASDGLNGLVDGNSVVTLSKAANVNFAMEVGMQVQIQGMSAAVGVASNKGFNYDGTWLVTAIDASSATNPTFTIASNEKEKTKGIPTSDTYLGFNNPAGNLRAVVSRVYINANSATFNMLETDGCESRDVLGIRDTGWEPYQFFAARLAQSDSLALSGAKRRCGLGDQNNTQTIIITGKDFGATTTDGLQTPLKVTMKQKICDCKTKLDGTEAPCMSTTFQQCYAKEAGTCPTGTLDCSTNNEYEDPRELQIKSHTHTEIEVYSWPGYGRRHQIEIIIGKDRSATPTNAEESFMRYMPPTVTGFETPASQNGGSTIYRPDGNSRITILGFNFGANNVTTKIDIRIGVEYDDQGEYCGDKERCMKKCREPQWYPSKEGGDSLTRGFPYIDCIIPRDTAGFKNVSIVIAGQKDDCSTNNKLCGLPISFPSDRRPVAIDENTNLTALINSIEGDPNGGLIFTCARSSETTQSYAKPGELCEDIDNALNNEECEDAACSKPKARPGFFRLDLDLQFACNQGDNGEPCQANLNEVPDLSTTGGGTAFYSYSDLQAAISNSEDKEASNFQLCSVGVPNPQNITQCDSTTRRFLEDGTEAVAGGHPVQCSKRGGTSPGTCMFRRPKEAKRALGEKYWPFACPKADLTEELAADKLAGDLDQTTARQKCRASDPTAYDQVVELQMPGCPAARTGHLTDYSIYEEFPSLDMSTNCYSVVACAPKSSCTGNNQCDDGYSYSKYKCQAFNVQNPNKTSCDSDYDCRTRSRFKNDGLIPDSGFSSSCTLSNPEDCSRCKRTTDPITGTTEGRCECTGGAARCGLCNAPVTEEEAELAIFAAGGTADTSPEGDGYIYFAKNSYGYEEFGDRILLKEFVRKGYRRLNGECQKCPDNPELIIAAMVCGILVFLIGAWWMEDKKVNVAFLSIGMDYFQVLSIFARIPVKWPRWIKTVLQVLSVFNFNIDIAAPECLDLDITYANKWWFMILLPILFFGILVVIFLLILCKKFLMKMLKMGGKSPKYCSHGNKLYAVFIIVFYCIYLSVTRRALDIFNCNPVDPPDGYLYTEFTSAECDGGICRCDDPAELQFQLKLPATLALIFYTIGFPLFVIAITWFYRVQMKLDQLLRAHDLGEARSEAVDNIQLRPRKCRSRTKATYDIRKKYHKLYYHFKPGKVYWMLLVLIRKAGLSIFALLFRRNVSFMLSCCLLLLFMCYVLQVRHRPYMSSIEKDSVKEEHRLKAHEAELQLHENNMDDIDKDLFMHLQMNRAITQLQENLEKKRNKQRNKVVRSLSMAAARQKTTATKDYYFDYNTVEQVLIACAIFLCLIAIMFESGQFYITDPETGLQILNEEDSEVKGFYSAVLAFGGIVLIGSLVYYGIVFMAEVVGHVPGFLRKLCASKKSRQMKKNEDEEDDLDDEGFEMVQNNMYANPLADLEKAKAKAARGEARNKQLLEENKAKDKQTMEMMQQMKRLKQGNQRNLAAIKGHNHKSRTPRLRKEMAQQRVKSDV